MGQVKGGQFAGEDYEEGALGGFIFLTLASYYCIFTNDLEDNIDYRVFWLFVFAGFFLWNWEQIFISF